MPKHIKPHLSALILLIPLLMLPWYLNWIELPDRSRPLPARDVGPWSVALVESKPGKPYALFGGQKQKDYGIRFADGYPSHIRQAHLQVSEQPPALDVFDGHAHGSPYNLHTHVSFPHTLSHEHRLWLTVENWDASVHQISWPLNEVVSAPGF